MERKKQMVTIHRLLVLLLLTTIASGCATISKEQCTLGDWYQIGLADGQQGKSNMAADYSKDCAEYNVSVNVTQYNAGRDSGLSAYCSYENGVLMGEQGNSYENVCPADMAKDFLSGYRPYYNVTNTEEELRQARLKKERLKEALKEKNLDEDTRTDLKAQVRATKDEVDSLKDQLSTYEYELAIHKVNREIQQVERQIEDAKDTDKPALIERLNDLKDTREMIEDVQATETGIKTIKDLIKLF